MRDSISKVISELESLITSHDLGRKSCDVMRDSNSEITFEMAERILSANFRPSIGEEQGREGIFSRGEK